MTVPLLAFTIPDAVRQFTEGGKLSNLSFWGFEIHCMARCPSYQNPPVYTANAISASQAYLHDPSHSSKRWEVFEDGTVEYLTFRRYSDFEWLQQNLAEEFPSLVIPPIPDKATDGTLDKFQDLVSTKTRERASDHPLVSMRMRRMERFLNALTLVPKLCNSEKLRAFVCMDEQQWTRFREEVQQLKHPTRWDAVKDKSFSMWQSIVKVAEKKVVIFGPGSKMHSIRATQKEFSSTLTICTHHMDRIRKENEVVPQSYTQIDSMCTPYGGKNLPPTLVFDGHFASDREHPVGTIKFVDDDHLAYVDWGTGDIQVVKDSELNFPPTGVVDPVMMALHESILQVESYFQYITRRSEARQLDELIDEGWFHSQLCTAIVAFIDALEAFGQSHQAAANDAAREKDTTKRANLEEKASRMQREFEQRQADFQEQYQTIWRPMQRSAFNKMMRLAGSVGFNILNDDQWESRMQRSDALIPCNFGVPPEVLKAMEKREGKAPVPPPIQQPVAAPLPARVDTDVEQVITSIAAVKTDADWGTGAPAAATTPVQRTDNRSFGADAAPPAGATTSQRAFQPEAQPPRSPESQKNRTASKPVDSTSFSFDSQSDAFKESKPRTTSTTTPPAQQGVKNTSFDAFFESKPRATSQAKPRDPTPPANFGLEDAAPPPIEAEPAAADVEVTVAAVHVDPQAAPPPEEH